MFYEALEGSCLLGLFRAAFLRDPYNQDLDIEGAVPQLLVCICIYVYTQNIP